MNKRLLAFVSAGGLLLAGCFVTSVHPFYTNRDISYEPSLVGNWTNVQNAGESWTFAKQGQNAYQLTYMSDGKTNLIRATLFKLSGTMLFDLAAMDQETDILPPPIPSHFLLRVVQLTPVLRLASMNNDWLKALLDKEPTTLRHEMLGEKPDDRRVVLTADTSAMQTFLIKHLGTREAWNDAFDLKRF